MQITFDLNNQADIDNVRRILDAHLGEVKPVAKKQTAKDTGATTATATSTTSAAAKEVDASASANAATSRSEPATTITLEKLTEVTLAMGKANKRDQLLGILKEYGVAKASLIPQDQWAAYVKKCEAVLAT